MTKELTKPEREKLDDFKQLYRRLTNSSNNKDIDDVIEALFLNVENYYLEFKDEIPTVSVDKEIYQYHLLQPEDGKYTLLDFLINRALTNAENICFSEGNAFDLAKRVDINRERYAKYEGKYPTDFLNKQKLKSKLHETSHALHAYDDIDDQMIHPGKEGNSDYRPLFERVRIMQEMLGDKYKNMLTSDDLKNAGEKYSLAYFSQPFGEPLASEGITEMYAVLFSKLINEKENREPIHIGGNNYVIVPNQFNGYSPFQRFYFNLRSNVSRETLFNSLFFGESSAYLDFAERYATSINKHWEDARKTRDALKRVNESRKAIGVELISTETTEEKFQALLHKASYDCVYGEGPNEITNDAQSALDKIFLDAYKTRISSGNYDPEEMKRELAVACNLSTFSFDPATSTTSATAVTTEYIGLYHQISAEVERNKQKQASQYSLQKENIIQDFFTTDTEYGGMTDEEIRRAQENIGKPKQ